MSKTTKIIAAVVSLLVLSSCGCCLISGTFGASDVAERDARERQAIDAARAACTAPRSFRLRAGGLRSLAADWECVGAEVIAAEEAARVAEAEARRRAAEAAAATAATPPPEARVEPEAAPEAEPEPTDAAHPVGATFAMGEFSYEFTRLRLRRRVGGEFVGVSAPEGATYLVVEYRERNDGDSVAGSLGRVAMGVTDAEGRRFPPDEDAMRRALLAGDDIEQVGDQLMPGVWHRRQVIFQIPEESARGDVDVVLDARGAFTGGGIVRGRPR